jgi:hypothetical protein
LTAAISQLATDLTQALTDLQNAINSGGGDLTSEVAALAAINTKVQTMDAQASAADPAGVPVISSPATASAPLNVVFTYQIAASKNPTSFDAPGLPAGLTVDTTKGVISGTPTAAGVTTVTIKATNASGTGIGTLTITVS